MVGCEFTVTVRREAGGWYYCAYIGCRLLVEGWVRGSREEAMMHGILDGKEALDEQRKESEE